MLVDTGSPFTYICDEAIQSFRRTVSNPHNPRCKRARAKLRCHRVSVRINSNPVLVLESPEDRHFNILGTYFMKTLKCVLNVDFGAETAKLTSNFN